MIKDLFIYNLKENGKLILAFTGILLMYGTISVGMFDPDSAETLQAMLDLMPEAMIRMLGFDNLGESMVQYVSNYLYGFIMILFPIIFIVMVGNKLVAKHVDKGSMIYLITMPYTRKQIITTQAVFFVLALMFMLLVDLAVLLTMSATMFPGLLEYGTFLVLNLVTLSLYFLLAGITFMISTIFRYASRSVGLSGGILFVFVILSMLSGISEQTEFLAFLTPVSLLNIDYILEGGGNGIIRAIILLILSFGLFYGSIEIFDKKSIII